MTQFTPEDQQFAINALTTLRASLFTNYSQDDKHSAAWESYGYKGTLTFENFYQMYDRFGIAQGVVEIPVDETWSSMPTIDGPAALVAAIAKLDDKAGFWASLIELDKRQRVGMYGCIVPEIRDNNTLDKKPSASGPESVKAFKPLFEAQIQPIEWYDDGSPKRWQIQEDATGDKSRSAGRNGDIHLDRVMHWAEGASGSTVEGRSCLRSCFNSLVTLEKLIGAGGEGFFKNAKGGKAFSFDKDAAPQAFVTAMGATSMDEAKTKFNEKLARYNTGLDAALVTGNMTMTPDVVSLASPEHFFKAALNDVAASSRIPGTVLIGQQTGRLASDEDQYQLAKMATARRARFVTPMIRRTIQWLQRIKVLPAGEFTVEWPDLFEPAISEKLDNLGKLAGTVSKAGYALNMKASLEHFGIPPELVDGEPDDLTEDEDNDQPHNPAE